MPLSDVTTTFNLHDYFGNDFDPRRVKAWATINTDGQKVSDTSTGETRIGAGYASINSDGTGSFTHWAPGPDGNPTSWQTTYHFDVPDRGASSGRRIESLGPFTVTASGLLTALELEQAIPPTYIGQAIDTINAAGTTQVGLVNTAGTTQVGNVNTAGAVQTAAAQASADDSATSAAASHVSRVGAETARDAADLIALGDADAALGAAFDNESSATTARLGAKIRSGVGEVPDALAASTATLVTSGPRTVAPGVDATGATECAAGLQTLLNDNAAADTLTRLQGTFKIGSTLIIRGNVDADSAVFNYTGTTTAITIGDSTVGQVHRRHIRLGEIAHAAKPASGWTVGSVGLKVTNTFRTTIGYRRIQGFETGLLELGDGSYGLGGVAYCTFNCGSLDNNLVNQSLQLAAGAATPFVNQNVYIGGSWSHSEGTYPVAGMRQILIGTTGGGSLNNNLWIEASLEGQREEFILDIYGNDNMWIHCRWEFVGNPGPIRWRPSAARNMIIAGYEVGSISETSDSGSIANNIIGSQRADFETVGDGGFTLSAGSGGSNSPLTIMPTGWKRLALTKAANYVLKFGAGGEFIKVKSSADTSDRWTLDISRKMRLGSGIDTKASAIHWGANSPEGVVTASIGSTYHNYAGTGFGQYVKGSGTGNTGWQATGHQPFTTAARPTPTLAGIGGTYYDTTLSKPGFSDGTTWRDAAGTAI